jgi:hypothetical protein
MRSMKTPLLLGSLLLLTAGAAMAGPVVTARVPFPFMVRDRMLPAGDYRVERADVDPTVLIIKGEHGVHSMVITSSVEAHGKDPAGDSSALVFTREGQQLPSQGRLGRSRRRPGDPEALTFRMIRRGQSPTASRIRGLSPLSVRHRGLSPLSVCGTASSRLRRIGG